MRITHPYLIHVSHLRWDICPPHIGHVTQFSQSNVTLRTICPFWAEDWSAVTCVLLFYLFYENGLFQVGTAPAAWILDEEKTRMKTKPRGQVADPEMPHLIREQETNILVLSSWDLMVLIGTASPGGNCTEYAEQNWSFLFYWWDFWPEYPLNFFLYFWNPETLLWYIFIWVILFLFFLEQSRSFQFAYLTLHSRQVVFYRDGCYFHY